MRGQETPREKAAAIAEMRNRPEDGAEIIQISRHTWDWCLDVAESLQAALDRKKLGVMGLRPCGCLGGYDARPDLVTLEIGLNSPGTLRSATRDEMAAVPTRCDVCDPRELIEECGP